MRPIGLAMLLLAAATVASAAPYDESATMSCVIQTVMRCNGSGDCARGPAASVRLPAALAIDVPARRVSGPDSDLAVEIVSTAHAGGRLVLHGEELDAGTAWNVMIEESTGEMRGGVVTRDGAYLVFGACSAR